MSIKNMELSARNIYIYNLEGGTYRIYHNNIYLKRVIMYSKLDIYAFNTMNPVQSER